MFGPCLSPARPRWMRRPSSNEGKPTSPQPSIRSATPNSLSLSYTEKERGDQAPGELQLSPNHLQRKEIKLSEEEGVTLVCKAPAPSLAWNTAPLGAPPALRVCGVTLWSRGPKCEKVFNCESAWRCQAHEVHHLCMKVLKSSEFLCL